MSAPDFDLGALEAYLAREWPQLGTPLRATRCTQGQSNPTYRLEGPGGRAVLRRRPFGKLLPSAHAVDREFRLLGALADTDVPVARPLHYCGDASVIGAAFYLMAFVEGRVIVDPALPDATPAERAAAYDSVLRTLVALQRVEPHARGLRDFGRAEGYFQRQIERWTTQYRAAESERIEAMEALIAGLPGAAPADAAPVVIVHGDFRIDNLMWAPDSARVAALLDFELATLGDPLADLAYFCMALRLPRNPVLPGLAGLDRVALGIPEEPALIARYLELGGPARTEHLRFALAFNFFRLAAIAQGVLARARQGNASSATAEAAGRMAPTIAALGAELIA